MRKMILMFVLALTFAGSAFAADAPAADCTPQLDVAALEAPIATPVEAAIAGPETLEMASSCERDCQAGYRQCLVICSKNPCLISCEDQRMYCLQGC